MPVTVIFTCVVCAAFPLMDESVALINSRARLYLKLPLGADAKTIEAAEIIESAFQ